MKTFTGAHLSRIPEQLQYPFPDCKSFSIIVRDSGRVSADPSRRRSWPSLLDVLASLGVVVLIKLLEPLPAASRIKSIEFAKVKASFGGTEDVGLFFNDKASRRIFTNGRASIGKCMGSKRRQFH